jgi:hypothetical protein
MKTCDRTVLSLGSDPRGDIVDLDEDAFPLPVWMRNAAEAIFDQLPAGRTPAARSAASAAKVGLAAGGVASILQR